MGYQYTVPILRLIILVGAALQLSACDLFKGEELQGGTDMPEFTFAVAKSVPTLPWFLAETDEVFARYSDEYQVGITFQPGSYESVIGDFSRGDVHAVVMTNIDAIGRLIRSNVEADVVLICGYSNGHDAILVPPGTKNESIVGKTVGLQQFSVSHYLLDRYLLKNQIELDQVTIKSQSEEELESSFEQGEVAAIVASNPLVERLTREQKAEVLFDSHLIPNEISYLLIVRRDVAEEYPAFPRALLATWFTVMESFQGGRRDSALDSLAALGEIERQVFDRQLMSSFSLTDTQGKAISTIRERRQMKKSMRHVRYFMERYELTGDVGATAWVSYPGRAAALLHFNAQPLQDFIAPPEGEL